MNPYFQSRYTFDPARQIVWKEIVRFLGTNLPSDGVVLDLGCGYGDFINQVICKTKFAIDATTDVQEFLKKDISFRAGKAWELEFLADASVDVVHASNLLEHLEDSELAMLMKQIRRVLKPNGTLILMQPNFRHMVRTYFDDYTHKKIFTDHSLASFLISNGFSIVCRKNKFLPSSMGARPSFMPVYAWMVRAYIHSPFKPRAGQMLFIAQKNDTSL